MQKVLAVLTKELRTVPDCYIGIVMDDQEIERIEKPDLGGTCDW